MSGLVLARLGRPAVVGDVVLWNDVRIEVTEVAGRGVADTVMSRVASTCRSNTSAKRLTRASSASAIGTCRPSSFDSDVTPRSEMPHGTISWNWSRSVCTLNAKPWLVIQREIRTPIAPIFPVPIHVPVRPATRPATSPWSAHTRIITSSRSRT